ncbi:MAG: sensor histidine kinase [Herbaspirillum sp.]
MRLKSLRVQLLVWLLVPLALFVSFNIWFTYTNAIAMATLVQDRMLLGSARIIGEQLRYEDDVVQAMIPPAALELFQSDSRDHVYYRIVAANGVLLSGQPDLPNPPQALHSEEARYFNLLFRGEMVRVVAFAQPVFAAPEQGAVLIEVAQTLRSHGKLSDQIWQHAVQQQVAMLLLMVLLVLLGLRYGLAPMMRLRDQVRQRGTNVVEPLDIAAVPRELAPLVDAINDYAQRLNEHMSAQGRFIANASHQLRTPLTVLNTQVDYGLRSPDIQGKDDALQAINGGVRHGIRLVNQLLTLSNAEVGSGHPLRQVEVNLVEVVQRVLEELASIALAKNIDLGCNFELGVALVRAGVSMPHELVSNLVDNALRYTPASGIVTVNVEVASDSIILQVEDNGPGIPEAEREHVFERFYRLQEDRSDGSGLGLSIVREIALASGAQVTLSSPTNACGLIVTVVFPLVQTPNGLAAAAGSR